MPITSIEVRYAVIGGGVAGGALATILARAGKPVLVLERDVQRKERIRGEYLVPWGVAEVQRLGLLEILLEAGAHWTRRQIPYGDGVAPDAARMLARDLGMVLPGVPGALCLGHGAICDALLAAATAAGAQVLRGAKLLELRPDAPLELSFEHRDEVHHVRPEIVIGADGRGSQVARMLGLRVEADEAHHLLGGLLVEDAEGWPAEDQTIGIFGNRVLYVFHQGRGRARLYAASGYEARRSWSGSTSVRSFLDAFRHDALPNGETLAASRPIGPLQAYPNHDCWIDNPTAPGVVLLGDAAGHNDPSLGQGLALAFRDVRVLSESLLGGGRDARKAFRDYVQGRGERMSRVRFAGRVLARSRYEFDDRARRRMDRLIAACAADSSMGALLGILLKGPEQAPSETFMQTRWDALLVE